MNSGRYGNHHDGEADNGSRCGSIGHGERNANSETRACTREKEWESNKDRRWTATTKICYERFAGVKNCSEKCCAFWDRAYW